MRFIKFIAAISMATVFAMAAPNPRPTHDPCPNAGLDPEPPTCDCMDGGKRADCCPRYCGS